MPEARRSRVRFWIVTVAAVVAVAVTASLGRWQLNRADQKLALQAQMGERSALPPLDNAALLASTSTPDAAAVAGVHHRGVVLTGRWVPQAQVFLDNRQMAGRVGFFHVMPLRIEGTERVVLVQRGWAPRDFQDRSRVPDVPTPEGTIRIEGRLAPPPAQLYQLGEAAPGVIRQNIDLPELALETGLNLLPLSVQQTGDADDGLLRQWPAPAVDVSRHHGYAFQWFALSSLLILLYLWFQILLPRRKRIPHGPDAR
ncbi:SURF1 family protein [uncultured Hydrogenophaga sp.]|uniref:SURF1 family protein n=1 Tax=uncultured Hydrogenophaga sp. TaxID=199683 RepID=UPI00265EBBBD|nr:SURF1 family protein [uncultured Hydrogenophaga sp.]